jgi:peptide deformylase
MKVVIAPDQRLRIDTKPVKKINPALLQTTSEMIKLTKTYTDPEGVGLAATQIGLSNSFFVAKTEKSGFLKVFNPKILSTGKRTKIYLEGCLSIPNYYGEVRRFTNIKVSFTDEAGDNITKDLKGILAWIFQHEIDHLNGVLFPDLVLQQKGKFYKAVGKDEHGTDIFEEVII